MSSSSVPTTKIIQRLFTTRLTTMTTAHDYAMQMNKTAVTRALGVEAMRPYPVLAGCVIAVIVLAGLCAITAAIYYVIFHTAAGKARTTRSNRSRNAESHSDGGGGGSNSERGAGSTHIFMFKKT